MDGSAVLSYLALVAALVLGAWATRHLGRLPRATRRVLRRAHLLAPEPPHPGGRPIEDLAASLRRLRAEVLAPRPGVTMARQRGVVAAYDDTLVLACRALQIETALAGLPLGLEHESERLRVEELLRRAGLVL